MDEIMVVLLVTDRKHRSYGTGSSTGNRRAGRKQNWQKYLLYLPLT